MAEFIQRWFTPSDSDGSGQVGNSNSRPAAPKAPAPKEKAKGEAAPKQRSRSRFGGVAGRGSDSVLAGQADRIRKTLLGQ